MCTEQELEQASERGARKVLAEIFGDDCEAAKEDIKQLRGMLQTLRFLKNRFMETTTKIFTLAFWAVLFGALTMYVKSKMGN